MGERHADDCQPQASHPCGAQSVPGLNVPPGWQVLETHGPWPFVTWARLRSPDGSEREWHSHRARRGVSTPIADGVRQVRKETLRRMTLGVAGGFAFGSVLFAIGSWAAIAGAWSALDSNLAYFAGAAFFTAAALTQMWQCVLASLDPSGRLLWYQPRSAAWWSAVTLLVGALWFNVLTTAGLVGGLTVDEQDLVVWTPDALGSALFLVSGYIALAEYCHGRPRLLLRKVGWWVNASNLTGCVAFAVSAAGSVVLLSGVILDPRAANGGTLAGAMGFFMSAVLMVADRTEE